MDSIKRRLLPLLAALVLLCSCAAGTPVSSPSTASSESASAPVLSSVAPAPTSSEPALPIIQPDISPSPSDPAPEPTASIVVPSSAPSPSAAPVSESPVTAPSEEPVEVVVYVTRTGEKYHSDGCQYLSRSQIPISLEEAKASGYTPCSKCHPPR